MMGTQTKNLSNKEQMPIQLTILEAWTYVGSATGCLWAPLHSLQDPLLTLRTHVRKDQRVSGGIAIP